jgi:hypothetical protein
MDSETLIQIQNIIEKFGFPVFVALYGLLLFIERYISDSLFRIVRLQTKASESPG